jgi:hypothetical protein
VPYLLERPPPGQTLANNFLIGVAISLKIISYQGVFCPLAEKRFQSVTSNLIDVEGSVDYSTVPEIIR